MSDHDELTRRAQELAPGLVGLTRDEVRARVTGEGLTVRFAPEDGAVTAEFRYGRVTALLRDDLVVRTIVG